MASLLAVISISFLWTSYAFHPIPPPALSTAKPASVSPFFLQMSSDTVERTIQNIDLSKPAKKGMVKVIFDGSINNSSKSISLSKLKEKNISIREFFLSRKTRNLILSKDVNDVTIVEKPSRICMKRWAAFSEDFPIDSNLDISNDDTCEVVQAITRTEFPGLTMKSTVTLGCKLIVPNQSQMGDINDLPLSEAEGILNAQYQITLLDSELQPEGSTPIVWLYNKLVGKDKNGTSKEPVEAPSTSSFTTYTLESAKKNSDEIQFTSNAKLLVGVEFPKIFIRLLPVSLEKLEEQGSNSIQKTLVKEVGPAIERYYDSLARMMKD